MTASSSGSVVPGPIGARPPRWLIFSITVTGVMANTLIAPALPNIVDGLDVDASRAGLLVAAATFPGIFMAPVIGLLADRYGRREVIVPCLAIFGLFGGLAALAPNYTSLLVCRFLLGIGWAGLINLVVVIIGDHWEGRERTAMIGQNSAVLTASIALMPSLGGVLAQVGGWRATFLPYLLGLVTAVGAARHLPKGRRGEGRVSGQIRAAVQVLKSRRVAGSVAMGMAVFVLVFALFLTVLPLYLEDRFGLNAAGRGVVLGLPALTSTVAALALARLRGHFGTRRVLLAAWVLFGTAFALIAGAPSLPVLLGGALLYGFGEGLTIPTFQDTVTAAAPASSRGLVVAVFVGFMRAAQSIGPVAGGVALALTGPSAAFAMGAAAAAVIIGVQLTARWPDALEVPPSADSRLPTAGT